MRHMKYKGICIQDNGGIEYALEYHNSIQITHSYISHVSDRKQHDKNSDIQAEPYNPKKLGKLEYDILFYTITTESDIYNIRRIMRNTCKRPRLIVIWTNYELTDKHALQYIETELCYIVSGIRRNSRNKEDFDLNYTRVSLHTNKYGTILDQKEYYIVCFDKDKYSEFEEEIRDTGINKLHNSDDDDTEIEESGFIHKMQTNPIYYIPPDKYDRYIVLHKDGSTRLHIINHNKTVPMVSNMYEDEYTRYVVHEDPHVLQYLTRYDTRNKQVRRGVPPYRYITEMEYAHMKGLINDEYDIFGFEYVYPEGSAENYEYIENCCCIYSAEFVLNFFFELLKLYDKRIGETIE